MFMGESLSPVCRRRKLATTSSHHQVKAATERPLAVALHFRKGRQRLPPPLTPRLGGWKTEAVGCWPVCRRFLQPRATFNTQQGTHTMKGSKNLLSLGATAALAAAAAVNATPPPPSHTVGLISKNPPKNWVITYSCNSLTVFSMVVSAD